jgi:hypothetical protein
MKAPSRYSTTTRTEVAPAKIGEGPMGIAETDQRKQESDRNGVIHGIDKVNLPSAAAL